LPGIKAVDIAKMMLYFQGGYNDLLHRWISIQAMSIHAFCLVFRESTLGDGVEDCVLNGMTFFTREKLRERELLLESISQVRGAVVEAGVALGGTAIFVTALAQGRRPVHLYDVFGLIPPPSDAKDTPDAKKRYKIIAAGKSRGFGNQTYYGYQKDLLSQVQQNFKTCKVPTACVNFHKGLVENTMMNINFDVAYLHCDTDFYSAVYHCLVDGSPHVVIGGVIVIDDYYAYGPARNAVTDFFKEINSTHLKTSRNHVFRVTKTSVLSLTRLE